MTQLSSEAIKNSAVIERRIYYPLARHSPQNRFDYLEATTGPDSFNTVESTNALRGYLLKQLIFKSLLYFHGNLWRVDESSNCVTDAITGPHQTDTQTLRNWHQLLLLFENERGEKEAS
ncbi:MAG TPA: hypothetical protein VF528_10165 [Pyrinomonadaceae bacterium]|jgi:hypothetical protein